MLPTRGILLVTFLAIVGCQPRRPDFMSRVREDCAGGDRWACDLLDRLGHPEPAPPIGSPHPRRDALFLLTNSRPVSSLPGDLGKLAAAILDDPPDVASFVVHAMTGGSARMVAPVISRVVRMNPLITPRNLHGQLAAPEGWTAAQFQYLSNLDIDAVEQAQVEYIVDWCKLWLQDAVPNQPLRMDGDTMAVEVGYGRYSEARNAWSVLFPRRGAPAV